MLQADRADRAALLAHIAALEAALGRIAATTCCDRCEDAALVARAALRGAVGLGGTLEDTVHTEVGVARPARSVRVPDAPAGIGDVPLRVR